MKLEKEFQHITEHLFSTGSVVFDPQTLKISTEPWTIGWHGTDEREVGECSIMDVYNEIYVYLLTLKGWEKYEDNIRVYINAEGHYYEWYIDLRFEKEEDAEEAAEFLGEDIFYCGDEEE